MSTCKLQDCDLFPTVLTGQKSEDLSYKTCEPSFNHSESTQKFFSIEKLSDDDLLKIPKIELLCNIPDDSSLNPIAFEYLNLTVSNFERSDLLEQSKLINSNGCLKVAPKSNEHLKKVNKSKRYWRTVSKSKQFSGQ